MHDEKSIRTENFLKMFLSDSLIDDKDGMLRKIVKYYVLYGRHQYHLVSRFVYNQMQISQDVIDYMLDNIYFMLRDMTMNREDFEKIAQSEGCDNTDAILLWIEKLYDHIALEEERLINNAKVMKINKSDIEMEVIRRFDSIRQNFQDRVDETSNALNANIMTVVGLFSAIIFVFFGGITALSSFVDGVFKIGTNEELRYPLLMLLVIGFIMFNTIFLLLYTISKIVNKNIGCWILKEYPKRYRLVGGENGCYNVYDNFDRNIKCYREEYGARKYKKRKERISNIWTIIKNGVRRVVFRFPFVFVIDLILILGILYVYFCL